MLGFFNKLNHSIVFKNWKRENKESFLSGCFTMLEDKEEFWQFDFYNKDTGKMTSFKVDKDIEVMPNDDVFSEDKELISGINIEEVKKDINVVLDNVNSKYNGVKKKIVILQNKKRLIWNITLLLGNLNVVNLNISAENGEVLKENKECLIKFSKP